MSHIIWAGIVVMAVFICSAVGTSKIYSAEPFEMGDKEYVCDRTDRQKEYDSKAP